ncbi:MAG: hypothetical protein ABWZ77_05320 [Naasia sp.]
MTDTDGPTNVKYLAEFSGGPLDGTTETRVLTDGEVDAEISSIATVGGAESLYWYVKGEAREIAGEQHVTYTFDPRDSDPVTADEEDDSLRF